MGSTAYLEKCTFVENVQTSDGGTVSTTASILKVANTFFAHNKGYDITYDDYINIKTYKCLFQYGNVSLKSNMKFFEQVAVTEKIISNGSTQNQIHTTFQETPYASSKMFIYRKNLPFLYDPCFTAIL